VLRCYQQNGRRAVPVNPREQVIEGALPPSWPSVNRRG